MLRNLEVCEHFVVSAADGEIGKVVNVLVDDAQWTVRHLVVQTDASLFSNARKVLVSPISFRHADASTQRFHLALTVDKIKSSPSIDMERSVSRQHERDYFRHYGYPYYWGYSGPWGMRASPGLLAAGGWSDVPTTSADDCGGAHWRSVAELRGYHVQGGDEGVGHMEDDIRVDLPREAIAKSPEWRSGVAIDREYEARLYDHYGRSVDGERGLPTRWFEADRQIIGCIQRRSHRLRRGIEVMNGARPHPIALEHSDPGRRAPGIADGRS